MLVHLRFFSALKQIINFKNHLFSLIILFWAAILLSSCGKRRPPVPPAQTSRQDSLSARQQGNRVILKIAVLAAKDLKQINIYRLNEEPSAPLFLAEDEYAARSTLIGTVDNLSTSQTESAFYSDILSNVTADSRLRYAVRLIYNEGRRSALSNFLIIEPNFQAANPPILTAINVDQTAIRLSWEKPETNLDETKPANISGYNIYRILSEPSNSASMTNPSPPELLNASPVIETTYADTKFEFGINYQYFVRTVTIGRNETVVESLNSNQQSVTPRDIFPPLAPQGLTIGAAPNRLSLFYAANSEPDVVGYLVFRTNNEKIPLSEWRKLTATPLTTTTFQDETVEAGEKYYYYLRAVDNAGNISQPSEVVTETVP